MLFLISSAPALPLTRLLHASYTPLTTGLNALSVASGPALSSSNAHVVVGDGRFGGGGGVGHALGGGAYGGLGVEELNGGYAPPAPGSFAAMAQAFLGPLEAIFVLFGPLEAFFLYGDGAGVLRPSQMTSNDAQFATYQPPPPPPPPYSPPPLLMLTYADMHSLLLPPRRSPRLRPY